MMRKRILLIIFTLAVLSGWMATRAHAEWLSTRYSQGNNVGLGVTTDWGCPFHWGSAPTQFPKGSGNFITNDVMTIAVASARDLNGDGEPEDTMILGSGGRDQMASRSSIFSYDVITATAAVSANMESDMGSRAGTGMVRVWTSLDADELADWPIEGREPRTASGTPVLHGAETMFTHTGDVFNSWGGPTIGFYMGWSLYFLDYAESNNMVYGHLFMQNVTEFMKYNSSYGIGTGQAGERLPDGWKWDGMLLILNQRTISYGGVACSWALHPEKEIVGHYNPDGNVASFTPTNPPLFGWKMLHKPTFQDQQAELLTMHTSGGAFGFEGAPNFLASGQPRGTIYRGLLGVADLYPGTLNPFNNKPMKGWPGMLDPEDDRFDQWLWGGFSWDDFTCYGELKDMEPRDTTACDFVMMFCYPGVTPLIEPELDLANIDDQQMQQGLATLEVYAEVADIVKTGGYILPATPSSPALTIIPGDREVTITWSDVNVQTPDPYYYFLQDHPDLDPNGTYEKYDFEGYRLYRSFVGPNDSHSELIFECSKSDGNIQYFFIDKLEEDHPYYRMRNGENIWYALVPFDKNYDTNTGEAFSLPNVNSGKTWNRPGDKLYNVVPRSEASDFRAATLVGPATYVGDGEIDAGIVELAGDGSGKLSEAPKNLIPQLDLVFEPVNSERIKQDMTVYVGCTKIAVDYGCAYWAYPTRIMALMDASSNVIMEASEFATRDDQAERLFMNTPDPAGVNYAVKMLYKRVGTRGNRDYAPVYIDFDTGSYTGAAVNNVHGTCKDYRIGTGPSIGAYIRTGVFEVTWSASGSDLTVSIQDKTRGVSVPYSPHPDDQGWGFMPGGSYMDFYSEQKDAIAKADRVNLMSDKVAADNTEEFALWINGIVWAFTDITAMPSSGSVFTITNCFGEWNGDMTAFTQYADAPYPGDKWQIDIKASTLDPEDADLSKVKVVPNPYLGSSFLDLSPMHRRIEFTNLPSRCTIRIYTLGGNLVNVLNHIGRNRQGWGNYTDWDRLVMNEPKLFAGYDNHGGTEPWNLRNRFGQTVASGLYFFHVTDLRGETYTGKFYIIN